MKSHKIYIAKGLCFILIVGLLVHGINKVLVPKFYVSNMWPTTSGLKGFYQMDENSIDVIYIGSSHSATTFIPQVVYDTNGITSYNLSCEQQNMLTSYYWLKEAYRYQSPKVVVLDTFMLFELSPSEPLNSPEGMTRKAIDSMRWSKVKWEAIHDIADKDPKQSVNSYIFTNIRFHDRWKNLTEQDFIYPSLDKKFELKGYVPLNDRAGSPDYTPMAGYDSTDMVEVLPLMRDYLDKIVDLCNEHDTQLILVKNPTVSWSVSRHNTIAAYALEKGIPFIDYNDASYFTEAGFVYTDDMNDYGHPNIWGAEKLSAHMAGLLQGQYGVVGHDDAAAWHDTYTYYQDIKRDCELSNITDIYEYLQAINQNRYTVIVAVANDASRYLDENLIKAFSDVGLNLNLQECESYYGIISTNNIVQDHGMGALSYVGSTRNKMVDFEVKSAGYYAGGSCSIKIDNDGYAQGGNGINIVVYCNDNWKVIDSMVYDGEIER
ncbi:MAG: hypothetical protein IKW81_01470 [Pseudobutyrivibrio sp.]|nr:hypothetical protein [Pseudobutyrivibrio sp.]